MDYLFYLNKLEEAERNRQIITIIFIWTIMLLVAGIAEYIKYKLRYRKSKTK